MRLGSGVWTRSRTTTLLALVVLGAASLRPHPAIDTAFALAASPSRLLCELATPVDLLRADEAHAAADSLF